MPVEAMLKGDDANRQDDTIEEHTEYESSDMAFFRGFKNGPKHSKSEKPSKGTQTISTFMHMNDMERRFETYTQVRIMIILVPP
jgi:hypothetical protein